MANKYVRITTDQFTAWIYDHDTPPFLTAVFHEKEDAMQFMDFLRFIGVEQFRAIEERKQKFYIAITRHELIVLITTIITSPEFGNIQQTKQINSDPDLNTEPEDQVGFDPAHPLADDLNDD